MAKQSVQSSTIAARDYNHLTQQLTVEFRNGATYTYEDVPGSLVDAFDQADSKGQFFHRNIKGQFAFQREE